MLSLFSLVFGFIRPLCSKLNSIDIHGLRDEQHEPIIIAQLSHNMFRLQLSVHFDNT